MVDCFTKFAKQYIQIYYYIFFPFLFLIPHANKYS